mgnify:FL=1
MQIHVLGDSIVTAYGSDENNFIGGWGDHLTVFLKMKYRCLFMQKAAGAAGVF